MDMMWYRRRGLMVTPHIESVTGAIASFNSDYNKIPIKSLICDIEPIQEGEGDPSPENVRPISGRAGLTVSHSGTDTSDPATISVNWETEAGTVYGGTLDIVSGKLTVDRAMVMLDGTHYTLGGRNTFTNVARYYVNQSIQLRARGRDSLVMADRATPSYDATIGISSNTPTGYYIWVYSPNTVFITLPVDVASSNAEATAWLAENSIQFVYELASPTEIQLTPQEVKTLLVNNIWCDSGEVFVNYWKWGK